MSAAGPAAKSRSIRLSPLVRSLDGEKRVPVDGEWSWAALEPGAALDPSDLDGTGAEWLEIGGPAPVAALLRDAGRWQEGDREDFDAQDHWLRCRLSGEAAAHAGRPVLWLGGLATIADVWLNGRALLHSRNMFVAHALDLAGLLEVDNELVFRFHALGPVLDERAPRPAWKTRLVRKQSLRRIRTSLLGRIPGWSPPVATVGPWAGVELRLQERFSVARAELRPTLAADLTRARIEAHFEIELLDGATPPADAELVVGEHRATLDCRSISEGVATISGGLEIVAPELWWPHTHGEPTLHATQLLLHDAHGTTTVDFGSLGLRRLELVGGENEPEYRLRVNGEDLFCRGACWTPPDAVLPRTDARACRRALEQVREAGMNMLRVGGTMVYEGDDFHRLCDELGILVWQDFMFANMDYPADEPDFDAEVELEVDQLLERIAPSPSLAMLCGGSEVEQQAAMMGLPRDQWRRPLFGELLPRLIREARVDVAYCPSTPCGGDLPFHVECGPSHYYGVGAYLKPLEDARIHAPRFSPECLAFSNVPADHTLHALLEDGESPAHHPRYKERVPRDSSAGWDFADVTDHYVERLFGQEARRLRYSDMERYLALSRVASAEMIAGAFGLWRRRESGSGGGLVWFLRDLWRGAGWGLVDSTGWPKAPYHHLKRLFQPVALWLVDDGIDGLIAYVDNETAAPIRGRLEIVLLREGGTVVAESSAPIEVSPRGQSRWRVEAVLGRFVDVTFDYRFGPPGHDVTLARVVRDDGEGGDDLEAFHFPHQLDLPRRSDLGLTARADRAGDGELLLSVRSERFAQSVSIQVRDHIPSDDHFHLAPGRERTIRLMPIEGARSPMGSVRALNGDHAVRIVFPKPTPSAGSA